MNVFIVVYEVIYYFVTFLFHFVTVDISVPIIVILK